MKRTLWTVLLLILLLGGAAGGAYTYRWFETRQVARDLELAAQALETGQPREARQLLDLRLNAARPGAPWVPDALALHLRALEAVGDHESLRAWAHQAVDAEEPWAPGGHPAWARAHVILGEQALEADQQDAARMHFEALLAAEGDVWGAQRARVGLGLIEVRSRDEQVVEQGRRRLLELYDQLPEDSDLQWAVAEALGRVHLSRLMSRAPHGDDEIYRIQRGDTLDTIGRRFNVSPELLMRINHIGSPRQLTIGRRIKVPELDLSIVVDKTHNTLTLYNHGEFFKKYRVRTGEEDYMTPVGTFQIENKKIDPVWNNPHNHRQYAAGHPENELGCRWMSFQGSGLGIHEAIDPATVGGYSSNGCVGLVREDVVELFDLVRVGTPVEIVGRMVAARN